MNTNFSTINLLDKKHEESKSLAQIRHLSKFITTIVLVCYVVGSAGFLGWTVYQSAKTVRVSNELENLTGEVTSRAKEEVFVRKLDAKATDTINFLAARPKIVEMADVLIKSEIEPKGWAFDVATGIQRIEAVGSSSADINVFVDYMTQSYPQVKLEKLAFTQLDGWVGTVVVSGALNK